MSTVDEIVTNSTKVLWIRNCRHTLGGQLVEYAAVSGGRTLWSPCWNYDVISEIRLPIFTWRTIVPNLTRSNLKWLSLGLFLKSVTPNKKKKSI